MPKLLELRAKLADEIEKKHPNKEGVRFSDAEVMAMYLYGQVRELREANTIHQREKSAYENRIIELEKLYVALEDRIKRLEGKP